MVNLYLSEMTVSQKHGGGLTLIRVLKDDLFRFDRLVFPVQFPVAGFENIAGLREREVNLWQTPGEHVGLPVPPRFSLDYFRNRVKRLLKIPNPAYINWDYYRTVFVNYLGRNFDLSSARILVVPQNAHSIVLANALHRRYKMKYATWMMDDHLLRFEPSTSKYEYGYPPGIEDEMKYHLQNASHIFTISENLGEFYRARFNTKYSVLFGPADAQPLVIAPRAATGTLKFCHFGRIWKWSMDAVQRFASRLEYLDATLDIYSHFNTDDVLLKNPRVRILPSVEADKVMDAMKQYDAVTVFAGFDHDVRHLTEMNISTKLSECLASGVPAILVAPEYSAMISWAKKRSCGILVTEPENESQLSEIAKLRDPSFVQDQVQNALHVSRTNTSVDAMHAVWRDGWSKTQ